MTIPYRTPGERAAYLDPRSVFRLSSEEKAQIRAEILSPGRRTLGDALQDLTRKVTEARREFAAREGIPLDEAEAVFAYGPELTLAIRFRRRGEL